MLEETHRACSSWWPSAMMCTSSPVAWLFVITVIAAEIFGSCHASQLSNAASSLTLIYQNNLNASDDVNHVGALLLDPGPSNTAEKACSALSESLLAQSTISNYSKDFTEALAYLSYAYAIGPSYQIANNEVGRLDNEQITFAAHSSSQQPLPILCSQTSVAAEPFNATASATNEVSISTGGNTYVGYRDKKSFRFLGMRYANPPNRFEYSSLYSGKGKTINATTYGSQCVQAGGGSEDCLFVNVQTPYLPKAGSKDRLRPVLFYIHGGGFTGGSGSDPATDGGNLASREDIVTVTIQYRLSTLGFLAVPGTNIRGNFGIGDQINALRWTINNIASFGGDPHHLTIMGESAGAGSVRALLGSPEAKGLFQGAAMTSNLGGGIDLGLKMNYGTTYSNYLTINESYTLAGPQIFNESGCHQTNLSEQVACLKQVNASTLVSGDTVARYVVQDGKIVNTPQLDVTKRNGSSAFVPVLLGTAANDGASFSQYPPNPVRNLTEGLEIGLSINQTYAQAIVNSGLFPFHDTGNLTLDSFNVTQRVATDNTFRCVDEATAYAGAVTGTFPAMYYYQFERTIGGYNPNNLSGAPVTPGYPYGNPNLPYFKLHTADLPYIFGNFYQPFRDDADLYATQLVSSYFASFVRSGNPNPSPYYLRVRGRSYRRTLLAQQQTGPWERVSSEDGPIRYLDYPGRNGDFVDKPQCAWLNYSISYYLE